MGRKFHFQLSIYFSSSFILFSVCIGTRNKNFQRIAKLMCAMPKCIPKCTSIFLRNKKPARGKTYTIEMQASQYVTTKWTIRADIKKPVIFITGFWCRLRKSNTNAPNRWLAPKRGLCSVSTRGKWWSWGDSNPCPNIFFKSFLHAYFRIDCRRLTGPEQTNQPLSWILLKHPSQPSDAAICFFWWVGGGTW